MQKKSIIFNATWVHPKGVFCMNLSLHNRIIFEYSWEYAFHFDASIY